MSNEVVHRCMFIATFPLSLQHAEIKKLSDETGTSPASITATVESYANQPGFKLAQQSAQRASDFPRRKRLIEAFAHGRAALARRDAFEQATRSIAMVVNPDGSISPALADEV